MEFKTFFSMPWRHWVLCLLTGLVCSSVLAQWQWVDETGRKVFSDTAPPISVPDTSILKRPGLHTNTNAAGTNTPATGTDAAAPLDTGAAPKLSGRDEQLETRKKQAEEAEQAKKKADEERQAKVRAENCERAKRAKSTLDSGIRIATTNAKGEREILDDAGRATEAKRLQDIIRSECSARVN
ncbi:MAG: DUF4124 domain-containing protein [Hydrogenophaga sp.]|jgi:hypothetical protein|uniref:DUF4124 domain-containing protein n=1 Tax=Hydrogenophaga sp. TaxID=1904254 RepID=UPI0027204C14|nr:DUF4124 domain-containing protein [Hydrogenophaga sp.]MDO9481191.1 DUF4124 domain-containing protein [Hydrogenophaga sp.]MDP3344843.1 DUF4124 domain-containing protein [Hydrogenophaga sp.]MDP3805489.1 DUF4124 domain-containing protein [Hydrogenophaga sp.]